MKNIIDKIMHDDFMDKRERVLYDLIKYEFPNINNLKVEYSSVKGNMIVSFDTTEDYTSRKILNKINEYATSAKKLKHE